MPSSSALVPSSPEARAGKIQALGGWPILVRNAEVALSLKKSQTRWRILTLDTNGQPRGKARSLAKTGRISLATDALYHLALRE